jgi:monofunctional biosynthetic peptidoglycan transglycosylase
LSRRARRSAAPSARRRWARRAGRLLLGLAALSVAQVLLLRWVDPPLTLTQLGRAVALSREAGAPRWPARDWAPLEALGADLPRAVVSSEDARFFLHSGFDLRGICAAWEKNRAGGRLRGGSTISQQVARNVFLWQQRSWLRKGLEAWYTVWLELLLPKARILEVYLNVAEWGPTAFGAEAAARAWYGVPAARLGAERAGRLAALLPAPVRRRPDGSAAARRAAWIAANPAPFPGDPGFAEAAAADGGLLAGGERCLRAARR